MPRHNLHLRTCSARQLSVLLRLTPRPHPVTNPLRHTSTSLSLLPLSSHLHTTPTARATARAVPGRDRLSEARFTHADIPPQSFFASQLRPPLVRPDTALTPESCHRAVTQYVGLALTRSGRWREKLPLRDDDDGEDPPHDQGQQQRQQRQRAPLPSLETLHAAASAIALSPRAGRPTDLALHILHTGVTRAYPPSVLTMVRIALVSSGALGRPFLAPAEEALRRLAEGRGAGGDGDRDTRYAPDACTLMGLICAAKGTCRDDEAALMWFRRAAEFARGGDVGAGGDEKEGGVEKEKEKERDEDEDRWQWRTSFLLAAAEIRLKMGEEGKAKPLLQYAADVGDNADACFMYSLLLNEDDPKRPFYMEKAAVSGVQYACRELGTKMMKQVDEEGLSRRERKERQVLAGEWLALAGDQAVV
ncbi:hypothetical protein F5X99DRAFT_243339 [Biscogniauxia marginata]|nr:hypothetical protein F5X99DRAFT_243339 [Biscogniauxia marginata]